jgi:hypothetical protein
MQRIASAFLAGLIATGIGIRPPAPRVDYVSPRELASVPVTVRTQLEARQCLIPIAHAGTGATPAVIRGAFHRIEDQDWAILCSRSADGKARRSTLFVFGKIHGWRADSVGASMRDRPFPGFTAADSALPHHALDWLVSVANRSLIPEALRSCPQSVPECPTQGERRAPLHDGILQGERSDGATSIYYWTGRRWVELPGGD